MEPAIGMPVRQLRERKGKLAMVCVGFGSRMWGGCRWDGKMEGMRDSRGVRKRV